MNEGEANVYLSALRVTRFGFTTAPATERISHIRHRPLANFVYMLGTAFTQCAFRENPWVTISSDGLTSVSRFD